MPPYVPLPYASKFGNLWVRLKYVGSNDPPSRDYVAEELLFQSSWVNPQDIYSFISLPNRREFELCFLQEAPLRWFLEIHHANLNHPKWRNVTTIVMKFWTGRVPDQDIELYLQRYCEVLQPPVKPVDKFGLWYGVRKFKVRMRRDESGHIVSIPNSISLGPFNGRIIYPGQANRCFICQALDHQARDCPTFKCWKCGELVRCFICQDLDHQARECPTIKCWKCGDLGHKAKDCHNESECFLCGVKGHTFFKCPKSFVNILKSSQQPRPSDTLDFPSLEEPSQAMDSPMIVQERETTPPPPSPSPPIPASQSLSVSSGSDNPQMEYQNTQDEDESDEELDSNLVIETSDVENKSDSDDEELDSENTSDSNGDSEDLGSFPLTEAASLAIAALPEETEEKRKTFFSGSHPALDELVNENMRGGRKRSVSASSCGRDKRKDNRPSPPSTEKKNNEPETWKSLPLGCIETVSLISDLWTQMLNFLPLVSFFLNE
ncbi:hypothetical protein ACER0C_001388 [Sarotherodon galilaeus]